MLGLWLGSACVAFGIEAATMDGRGEAAIARGVGDDLDVGSYERTEEGKSVHKIMIPDVRVGFGAVLFQKIVDNLQPPCIYFS